MNEQYFWTNFLINYRFFTEWKILLNDWTKELNLFWTIEKKTNKMDHQQTINEMKKTYLSLHTGTQGNLFL